MKVVPIFMPDDDHRTRKSMVEKLPATSDATPRRNECDAGESRRYFDVKSKLCVFEPDFTSADSSLSAL